MLNWNDIAQKVVGGILLTLCLVLVGYSTTRAGTAEVEALAKQHAEDIKASEAADEAMRASIRKSDRRFLAIAVTLDRMDRQAGGPGMPAAAMSGNP